MSDFSDFTLIVTAGPTREWIDPVRFISNPASGQTGWQVASQGLKRFRKVIFISGPGHPSFREVEGAENIYADTTEDMAEAVYRSVGPNSILIMTAAPADFTPETPLNSKIKKENRSHMEIRLKASRDILAGMKDRSYENFYRIGFAAETDNIVKNAADKLNRKNLDFICANAVHKNQKGFGRNENSLTVLDRNHEIYEIGTQTKESLAAELLDYLRKRIR